MSFKAAWEILPTRPKKDWPQKSIKFVEFSLKYRTDLDCVLENLNFEIKCPEKVIVIQVE